jgi:hypothetical protein
MRNAPLKIGSVVGLAVAVLVVVPLMIACAILYAIQGPDPASPRR